MSTKLAIIGAGKWGSKIVQTISRSTSLDLIAAVTSRSYRELQEIAPFEGVVFKDYQELSSLEKRPDGVIIATPPSGREQIIDYFLDQGVPVFSEKPLTLDVRQTARLTEKSRYSNTPLVEDFIHLYAWAYIAISQQTSPTSRLEIESIGGNIGPFRGYSPIYDYGPHDLSMTLQLFKCRPRSMAVEVIDQISEYKFSTRVELDFGSRGMASLRFGNTFKNKRRIFKCRVDGDEWCYDDTVKYKLSRNSHPYSPNGNFQHYSALELALNCFAGNYSLYSSDESLWLTDTVAELTAEIMNKI